MQRPAGRVEADREPPPPPAQQRQDGNARSVGGQSLLHHCPAAYAAADAIAKITASAHALM
ncbi:hypothetical protein Psuf_088640 [Phytohabitans suffuscus]|uniref:Uncharacterized protein n=1 Tax=Phytohabitans suffuscus TaxID=624315 RepID=A0A6F8Z0E7_9ACTN|nr:hypothetical protein Psuf_088640 [Phytohabitans suffuscus]